MTEERNIKMMFVSALVGFQLVVGSLGYLAMVDKFKIINMEDGKTKIVIILR